MWADTAYRSAVNLTLLDRHCYRAESQHRKPRRRWMPEHIRRGNASEPKVRARVEYVFTAQKRRFDLVIRSIGLTRATAKIGLANLAHHFTRLAWLQGREAPD